VQPVLARPRPTTPWMKGPRSIRGAVRATGKGLIGLGVLLLLFVAYQLWGTGIAERRAQSSLRAQFEQQRPLPPQAAPAPAPTLAAPTTTPPPDLGEAIASIKIPRIDLEKFVVEGVGVEDLKKGPGHYPGTAMPGETGNAAIAGHRTTYGAPFGRLDELEAGDSIVVATRTGEFRYEVTESKIVSPEDVWVLDPTPDGRLTLTTCHPRYSAAQRLIIVAALITPPPTLAPPAGQPVPVSAPPAGPPVAYRPGLSGESASIRPAIAWGSAAAAVWIGAWLVARRSRRSLVYLLATPIFLMLLFGFFENVAAFLPANA
jgi:sortase A